MGKRYSLSVLLEVKGAKRGRGELEGLGKGASSANKQVKGLKLGLAQLSTVVGALGFTRLVTQSVRAIEAQAEAEAKLESTVLRTGMASGWTADQLKAQAAALSDLTAVQDAEIISAQAILGTFKSIAGDIFPRATTAIVDMAAKLDQDLKSATIQVGKALNQPVEGVTALARAGVQFSDDQKAMIESLVQTNRLAEAQAIILAELESQFGGTTAAVASKTTSLGHLKTEWTDLLEKLGTGLRTGLEPAFSAIVNGLRFVNQNFEFSKAVALETLARMIESFSDSVDFWVKGFADMTTSLKRFLDLMPAWAPGVEQARDAIAGFESAVKGAQAEVRQLGDDLVDGLRIKATEAIEKQIELYKNSYVPAIDAATSAVDFHGDSAGAAGAKSASAADAAAQAWAEVARLAAGGASPIDFIGPDADKLRAAETFKKLAKIYEVELDKAIKAAAETLPDHFKKPTEETSETLRKGFFGVLDRIRDRFREGMSEAGKKIVQGLKDALWDLAAQFAERISQKIIDSPSGEARRSDAAGLTLTRDSDQEAKELGHDVGYAIGFAIGTYFFGALGPLLGEIFGAIGALLGDWINDASRAFFTFDVAIKSGEFAIQNLQQNKRDVEQLTELGSQVTDTLNQIFGALGGTLESLDNLQLFEQGGQFQVRRHEQVIASFGADMQAAIEFFMLEAIRTVEVSGMSEQMKAAIRQLAASAQGEGGVELFLHDLDNLQRIIGQSVSPAVRSMVEDFRDLYGTARRAGIGLGDVVDLLKDGLSNLAENILGPIAQWLPELEDGSAVFDQVRQDVAAHNAALQQEIANYSAQLADLEAQIQHALFLAENAAMLGGTMISDEALAELRSRAEEFAAIVEALTGQLIDPALVDKAERRADAEKKKADRARRQAEEDRRAEERAAEIQSVVDALADVDVSRLSDAARRLHELDEHFAELLEKAGDNVELAAEVAAAHADEWTRTLAELRDGGYSAYSAFTGPQGLAGGLLSIADQAAGLKVELLELVDVGALTAAEFASMSAEIDSTRRSLQEQAIFGELESVLSGAYSLLGEEENLARLRYFLALATMKAKREELAAAIATLRNQELVAIASRDQLKTKNLEGDATASAATILEQGVAGLAQGMDSIVQQLHGAGTPIAQAVADRFREVFNGLAGGLLGAFNGLLSGLGVGFNEILDGIYYGADQVAVIVGAPRQRDAPDRARISERGEVQSGPIGPIVVASDMPGPDSIGYTPRSHFFQHFNSDDFTTRIQSMEMALEEIDRLIEALESSDPLELYNVIQDLQEEIESGGGGGGAAPIDELADALARLREQAQSTLDGILESFRSESPQSLLAALNSEFAELLSILGPSADLTEAWRLSVDRLLNETLAPARQALQGMLGGSGSPLGARGRLDFLQSQYDEYLAAFRAGDLSSISEIASLGDQIYSAAQDVYTSGGAELRLLQSGLAGVLQEILGTTIEGGPGEGIFSSGGLVDIQPLLETQDLARSENNARLDRLIELLEERPLVTEVA